MDHRVFSISRHQQRSRAIGCHRRRLTAIGGCRKDLWASLLVVAMAVVAACGPLCRAADNLPFVGSLFSHHMVLQREIPCPVWGWTTAGDIVTVTFAGQTLTAVAAEDGRWELRLAAMTASAAPRTMTVKSAAGKGSAEITDVLVGDVWICSGQSNMQMPVAGVNQAGAEMESANYPEIRLFTVPMAATPVPLSACGGEWRICSPETVGNFSAVGYFFGRHVHRQLEVPVGLINTSWGGTVAEAWTSELALRQALPEFSEGLDNLLNDEKTIENARQAYEGKMADYRAAVNELYNLEEKSDEAAAKYAVVDLDESEWKTMKLPANWETSPDFKDVDGIVWFRKTVDLPATWAGKDLMLRLGPIDEVDVTWFNSVEVGARGSMRRDDKRFWNVPREYPVPGRLVKAGPNVIAIRVLDNAGQGGLWGGKAEDMLVELADGSGDTRVPLAGEWRCQAEFVLPPRPGGPERPNRPSVLFNAMINPLIPAAVRGAIWYQGESNTGRAEQYRTLLPTLISDWRTRFGCGDFPFLIVQLANFRDRQPEPKESKWAELREAQAMTVDALPNVGMAVIIDIGDARDIHPRNKQDVGLRLGLAAEAIAYGRQIEFSGPVFKEMTVADGKAVLAFTHATGLVAKGGPLTGFAVAGANGSFVWAQAEIRNDTVAVWADGVEPVVVRYAWAENPDCNLYNAAGLPAAPFRTDRPAKTEQ